MLAAIPLAQLIWDTLEGGAKPGVCCLRFSAGVGWSSDGWIRSAK
jgi:hypothetical protein